MSAYNDYTETAVTNAAAVSATGPVKADRAVGRAIVQPSVDVRMRMDGTDPTTAIGFRLLADTVWEFDDGEVKAARFIAEAGAGVIRVGYR